MSNDSAAHDHNVTGLSGHIQEIDAVGQDIIQGAHVVDINNAFQAFNPFADVCYKLPVVSNFVFQVVDVVGMKVEPVADFIQQAQKCFLIGHALQEGFQLVKRVDCCGYAVAV
ncbi:hypothetical protein IMSAGC006_01623 [Muribaculaceae bacterium]|nr:hypothetical protein IMSAGC006_01623 [Muribaculaceae bacterium]